MKAKVEVVIQSFGVPDSVFLKADQGDATNASVKLSALDAETLDELCDHFRDEIFRKAGKSPPPKCLPG